MSDYGADVDGKFRIYWFSSDPTRIMLATDDEALAGPDAGDGLRIAFSSNPNSRDFNPRYFNRCARFLAGQGKQAPPEVQETSRRI